MTTESEGQQPVNATEMWLNGPYPIESMQKVKDPQVRIASALEYIAGRMHRIDEKLSLVLQHLSPETEGQLPPTKNR